MEAYYIAELRRLFNKECALIPLKLHHFCLVFYKRNTNLTIRKDSSVELCAEPGALRNTEVKM